MAIKRGDAWLVDRGRRRLAPSCLSQCHSRRPVFLARPVTVDRPLSSPTRRYARIYGSYPSLSPSLSSLFGPSLPKDNYAWSEGEGSVRYRRIIPGTVANKNDWNGCAWIRFGGGARGRGRISTIWSRSCLSTLPLGRALNES